MSIYNLLSPLSHSLARWVWLLLVMSIYNLLSPLSHSLARWVWLLLVMSIYNLLSPLSHSLARCVWLLLVMSIYNLLCPLSHSLARWVWLLLVMSIYNLLSPLSHSLAIWVWLLLVMSIYNLLSPLSHSLARWVWLLLVMSIYNLLSPLSHSLARCVWAPEEECRCPQCYDERQAVHAEFSQWVAADNRCGVKQFPAAQACSVLRGASVEFVGDSFVRHMFAALVILLSGGEEFSALLKPVPSNIQHICRGMHQFTALQCREYLNETRSLCNNTVQVRYTQVFPSKDFLFVPPILKRVSGSSKTLIVMGLGIHDDFQFDIVRKDFLLPVLNLHQYMGRFSPVSGQARPYLDLSRVLTNFTEANATLDHLIRMDRYEDNSFPWSPMCNLVKANFLDESFLQVKERSAHNILLNLDRDHGTPLQQASAQLPEGRNMKKELETSKQPQVIFQKFPDTTYNPQQSSPNLLWVGIHAPGLLKAPKFSRQTSQGVSYFNSNVRNLLKQWKVPFLDTFSFTDGAVSFDGTHYGWGVNMLKANMLIQYVQEELVGSKTWS
ncbi:hypothetical protein RRG08_019746 [Elysia crispata]|uniref:Uncharacterized protein n=1 Tax=Elysia crispata TaxID=231223 RepID=A0AAE0Y777_9GAST|nr:hypothetical protein RRG08_019746 [Elysia crispata]